MPELPDVEIFKPVFARNALRKTIERVVVNDRRILGKLAAPTFISRLQGASLVAAWRYGKHLLASIDRGGWLNLHFGMIGALQFVPKSQCCRRNRIDISKNSLHVEGLDDRGTIMLRQKWSRGRVEARLANMLPCLIGMKPAFARITSVASSRRLVMTLG